MAYNTIYGKEKNIEPYFDYLFLDESQDFEENFIELCDCITKNKVYIAGDIFQNIYVQVTLLNQSYYREIMTQKI